MKHTIITAGSASFELHFPKPFLDLCKAMKVKPPVALQQFLNYLSVYGFYCKGKTIPEATAAFIFDSLVHSNGELPEEPSREKRNVAARHLLRLSDEVFFVDDDAERAAKCRKIIEEWYCQLQNLKQ